MRIIGFGQQMRLDGKMRVQHEITVETDDGRHHVLPTDEATVQKLIELHATGAVTKTAPLREPPVPLMMDDIVPPWDGSPVNEVGAEFGADENSAEEEDLGEVVTRAVSAPATRAMPRPKFLEGDEDGNQI